MKLTLSISMLLCGGFGARAWLGWGERGCDAPREPSGDYIEARTASVFAGACHYNGEYMSAGREAVLAWRFDAAERVPDGEASSAGTVLGGLELAVLLVGDDNLAEPGTRVRAVVFIDSEASAAQERAALEWLRQNCAALPAEFTVERTAVDVHRDGDSYSVRAGTTVALSGAALVDRACCSMPFNVWYEPIAQVASHVVGCSEAFEVREPRTGALFTRRGHNDAFLGRFGARSADQNTPR